MTEPEALNLNLLRVFVAVYDAGNVTRAAEDLGMSQSAVSGALRRLGQAMDGPMFERTQNGVRPTPAAEQLIQPMRDALHAFSTGLIDMPEAQSSDAQRHFRIAVQNLAEATVCGPGLDQMARELPNVTIEIVPPFSVDFVAELRAGTLDFAFHVGTESPVVSDDIVLHNVGQTQWVYVTRKGWRDDFGPLTLDRLRRSGRVQLDIGRDDKGLPLLLAADLFETPPVSIVGRGWSIPGIVAGSDLVAFLPLAFAGYVLEPFGLEMHPIPHPFTLPTQYLLWHQRSDADAIHQRLRLILAQSGAPQRERIRQQWQAMNDAAEAEGLI